MYHPEFLVAAAIVFVISLISCTIAIVRRSIIPRRTKFKGDSRVINKKSSEEKYNILDTDVKLINKDI